MSEKQKVAAPYGMHTCTETYPKYFIDEKLDTKFISNEKVVA